MKANKLSLCGRDTDVSKFKAVKCAINFISPCKLLFVIYLYRNIQRDLALRYIDAQVKICA